MKLDRILVATSSADKLREMFQMLGDLPVAPVRPAEVGELPAVLEDGRTFRDNACKKALAFSEHFGMPVIAEDSGLEVDALSGRPGVRSRRYAGPAGNDLENNLKLLAELEGTPPERRTARYRCAVALAVPGEVLIVAEGTCEGRIAEKPRGRGGFGYDPLFFYPPFGVTFGELEAKLKNEVSHRAAALRRFKGFLRERLASEPDPLLP